MGQSLDRLAALLIAGTAECIAVTDDSTRVDFEAGFLSFAKDVGGVFGHLSGKGEGSGEG